MCPGKCLFFKRNPQDFVTVKTNWLWCIMFSVCFSCYSCIMFSVCFPTTVVSCFLCVFPLQLYHIFCVFFPLQLYHVICVLFLTTVMTLSLCVFPTTVDRVETVYSCRSCVSTCLWYCQSRVTVP